MNVGRRLKDAGANAPVGRDACDVCSNRSQSDTLRVYAAVEHMNAHGNLDGFQASRSERLALVSTAARQGLVVWSRFRKRYELTSRGRRQLRAVRRSRRNLGRSGATRLGMKAAAMAAGAALVAAVVLVAFNSAIPIKWEPAGSADADFATGAIPVHAPRAQEIQGPAGHEPKTVTAGDARASLAGQASTLPDKDSAAATVGVREERREPERPSTAAMPGGPPDVAADPGKIASEHDGRTTVAREPHERKRTGRRHPVARPAYAYSPYQGVERYPSQFTRGWSFDGFPMGRSQ